MNGAGKGKIGIIILIVVLVFLVFAAGLYVITIDDGAYSDDELKKNKNVPYVVEEELKNAMQGIAEGTSAGEDINSKRYFFGGYYYDIDLDELAETIIKRLEEEEGRLNVYITKNEKKIVKDMLRAELATQYPDLRKESEIGTEVSGDELQGLIKIIRHKDDGTEKVLEYMPLGPQDSTSTEELNGLINLANNGYTGSQKRALEYFSVDTQGNIIVVNWSRETKKTASGSYEVVYEEDEKNIYVDNNGEPDYFEEDNAKLESATLTGGVTYSAKSLNYKNIISQYTVPFNYMWAFLVCGRDEDFIEDFVNYILDSQIEISLYDNLNITQSKTIVAYDKQEYYHKKVRQEGKVTTEWLHTEKLTIEKLDKVLEDEKIQKTTHFYEAEYTETQTNSIVMAVTRANVWILDYEAKYTYEEVGGDNPDLNYETVRNTDLDIEWPEDGAIAHTTKDNADKVEYIYRYGTKDENDIIDAVKTIEADEFTTTISKSKENHHTTSSASNMNTYRYTLEGTPEVKEKTNKKAVEGDWDYPNFCQLYLESEKARPNIMGVESWLFEIIEKNAPDKLDLTKYLMYCITGVDYGVTEFNTSLFDPQKFSELGATSSSLLIEYIHAWENAGGAPMNADGTKYIVHDDGKGHPTVGYGVDIYNCGHTQEFLDAGYDISIGAEIDVEFVDNIEEMEIKDKTSGIETNLMGLDLTGYQKNAMISRAYNAGTGSLTSHKGAIGIRNGKNFVQAYEAYWSEDDDQFEEKNNKADFNHSLYSTYMYLPNTSDGEYMKGLENRRKSEWTLFQTGYYDRINKWHNDSNIIAVAKEIHDYMESEQYTYCVYFCNSYEECSSKAHCGLNSTFEESKTKHQKTCCATYVSWVLMECGYIDECKHSANGLKDYLLNEKGFTKITDLSELQPGDIMWKDHHVEIYAGDNLVYNAGSGSAIRNVPTPRSSINCTYGLRAPN